MKTIKSIYVEVELVNKIQQHAEENQMSFNAAAEEILEQYFSMARKKPAKKERAPKKGERYARALNDFINKEGRMPNKNEEAELKARYNE